MTGILFACREQRVLGVQDVVRRAKGERRPWVSINGRRVEQLRMQLPCIGVRRPCSIARVEDRALHVRVCQVSPLANRTPTAAGTADLSTNMPSYGSNDGYGRQQFSSRPSTRQTDIGRRQMQSSVMASILAEEDIVRKEEEEQPVGGRILAQQQQQQRRPQPQQGRPAPAQQQQQQQQQRAPPQHFQADPWEAMQRQQHERAHVEQEIAQREVALARMRHEEALLQSDDDGLRRLEQQRQAVLRKMAAEGRGPPSGGGGSPPLPGFGGRAYEASSSPAPPVTSERSSHRPVREVTWGAARAAETMTPRRSDELDHQGERAGEHAGARRDGRGWADPGGGWSTAGGARTREVGNPIAVERVPGAQHGVQGAQHGGYSAQHGGYSAAAAGGGGADWSAWAAGERPNAFEVRGLLRQSQKSSPPSSTRASPPAPNLSPNMSPSMRASHVHGTPDELAYKSHVGGVKMGYSGHVPGGRDHFGSAAVAGSMEVRWPLDCS